MSTRIRLLQCHLYSLRSYSSSSVLQPLRKKVPRHAFRLLATRDRNQDQSKGPRPFLSRHTGRDTTFVEKIARSRTKIQLKATVLSQSWPAGTSLIEPAQIEEQDPSDTTSSITNMTTNFMIYAPFRIRKGDSVSNAPNRQTILRDLRVMLLKRSSTANPFPNAWTAISGRLERTGGPDSISHAETPLEGALREIKEETSYDPVIFGLETALPPTIVSTPEGRQWRVWPILWQRQILMRLQPYKADEHVKLGEQDQHDEHDEHDQSSDHGVFNSYWHKERAGHLLRNFTRLNAENVEFRWVSLDEARALDGVVPGLLDTLDQLIERWIEERMQRFNAKKSARDEFDAWRAQYGWLEDEYDPDAGFDVGSDADSNADAGLGTTPLPPPSPADSDPAAKRKK